MIEQCKNEVADALGEKRDIESVIAGLRKLKRSTEAAKAEKSRLSKTFNQLYNPLPNSYALAIYFDRFVIAGVPQPLPRIAPISSKFR